MSDGSCKSCAEEANDGLAYMSTLGRGFKGASTAQLGPGIWVPPEWSQGPSGGCSVKKKKPAARKKGCQRQGPGCASKECNECADFAVDAINYHATLSDGIPRATMENILHAKMMGGFKPAAGFGGLAAHLRQSSGDFVEDARHEYEAHGGHGGDGVSETAEVFQIPASNASSDCVADAGCDTPAINAQTESEWTWLLSTPDLSCNVNDCDGNWEAFIRIAVNFLRWNEDIWVWILCMVFGNTAKGRGTTISDMLDTGDFTVRCDDNSDAFWCNEAGTHMITDPVFGVVRVCTENELMQGLFEIWRCGSAPERMAAVINLAAILLHELCHAAWYLADKEVDGCTRVDAIENTFLWACIQRYPATMEIGCMRLLADSRPAAFNPGTKTKVPTGGPRTATEMVYFPREDVFMNGGATSNDPQLDLSGTCTRVCSEA